MSDLYTEELIARKTSMVEKALRVVMILATALTLVAGIVISPLVLILFLVLVIVDLVKIPQFNLEYEYLYVNGELDIDKIIAKSKRKRVGTYTVSNMELIAPLSSRELAQARRDPSVKKVRDCSSGAGENRYGMVINTDGKKQIIIFEPNETMLRDIRRLSPRNVVTR